jgi:hypothetical protein
VEHGNTLDLPMSLEVVRAAQRANEDKQLDWLLEEWRVLLAPAFDYPEPHAAIRRSRFRRDWLSSKRSIDQVANLQTRSAMPSAIAGVATPHVCGTRLPKASRMELLH